MQQCLPPLVMTDLILEMNETFSLVLTSSDDDVTLEPFPNTTIIIVDDGSMYNCLTSYFVLSLSVSLSQR